ncbi:MAG: cupin domain-containing protein [Phormidesmis sp.]
MPTSPLSASEWPDSNPIVLPDLLSLAQQPNRLAWAPFRPGVEIHRLYGDGRNGPSAALLKYAPGASVPAHDHTGYEHIMVLSGAQRDHRGDYAAGTLVINLPGSGHAIASDEGCIVLIIWQQPVRMREATD